MVLSPAIATRVREGRSPPYPRPAQPSPQTGTIEAGAVATWNFQPSNFRRGFTTHTCSYWLPSSFAFRTGQAQLTHHHHCPPSAPARLSTISSSRSAFRSGQAQPRATFWTCFKPGASRHSLLPPAFGRSIPMRVATRGPAHSVGQARCELPLAAATAHSCGQARCEVPFAAATVHSADQADASCHSLLSPYVRLLKPDASCHSRLPPPVRLIGPDAICHLLCHRHLEEQARCEMRIAYPICVSYSLQRHLAR
jgi:hypothetical protein